ncbi:hypothetical protein BO99DRAFT_140114 [Aspergillus violaceofuscus CBS 115571]|uniref:Uncharacterized protein n=1 Tax=Aspergillus violaceofuscus (strain CBS 115571) TaxID=1450538 RepID=A0A2V5IIF1_ASPV1|nr:hypothetical protein BO99DRAFT_140114 [Aspergillus violaceofuscus CBS 115571]
MIDSSSFNTHQTHQGNGNKKRSLHRQMWLAFATFFFFFFFPLLSFSFFLGWSGPSVTSMEAFRGYVSSVGLETAWCVVSVVLASFPDYLLRYLAGCPGVE